MDLRGEQVLQAGVKSGLLNWIGDTLLLPQS
jgi:hypothetical protein